MNRTVIALSLISLLAGLFALAPASVFAERDGGFKRDRQQESRSQQHETRQQNQQRADKQRPQRVDRQNQHRVERQSPQRAERQDRREQRPAVAQHRFDEQRNRAVQQRRHVETRRTFHIERPRHISKPHYYRHVPRSRYFMGIRIYRPYGYLYPGFGFYYTDHDAFRWLAFTALTLTIIDHLDEQQQRMHEHAWIRATSADIGDTLYWDDRHASGSVTVIYIGTDSRGREYREFRQSVSARGRTETSYGSAYLKSNGNWEASRTD